MLKISREDGFTITELLVATTILLLVIGAVLTTFKNAVQINDAASQLGDSTQNLRAGTNLLIRDLMMAGRVFGAEGVASADLRRRAAVSSAPADRRVLQHRSGGHRRDRRHGPIDPEPAEYHHRVPAGAEHQELARPTSSRS